MLKARIQLLNKTNMVRGGVVGARRYIWSDVLMGVSINGGEHQMGAHLVTD